MVGRMTKERIEEIKKEMLLFDEMSAEQVSHLYPEYDPHGLSKIWYIIGKLSITIKEILEHAK